MQVTEALRYLGLAYLAGMNCAGLWAMGADKHIARRNGDLSRAGKRLRRRIPERRLFLLAALGGSLGVLLGMYGFRHKTKHWYFVLGIPAILLLQAASCYLVWRAAAG